MPLRLHARARDTDWTGLTWSAWRPLREVARAGPGLYRIASDGSGLLYVGESDDFGKRLKAYRGRDWGTPSPLISV
jgi:hypothetical protein